jgi:bacillithiol system protein YtxJ
MNWIQLEDISELEKINTESNEIVALIFKHSTKCPTSKNILSRLQKDWKEDEMDGKVKPYFLDLLQHRDISDKIADDYKVQHESPQMLLIKNGVCYYNSAHYDIDYYYVKKNV